MISIYLIFWMEFSAAIRMNGPTRTLSSRNR